MAERGFGEVNRGGELQQGKVIVDSVGVPVWVLKFPESMSDEKEPFLLLLCFSLPSYLDGFTLIGAVSAGHADDNVYGGCARAETSVL